MAAQIRTAPEEIAREEIARAKPPRPVTADRAGTTAGAAADAAGIIRKSALNRIA
ncbi:hypothetical protein DSM19430T_08030 [Desulfovibrio psychrotolerans]|uniref:Uncharacterized protein n=1 Tax=Desulfovibrio psychrotolerans TaxID=415242 RepID=A0A7J0BR09_9BACT|nr:hypothetical protein DSM19430T_08030 [Desulfovibrio psychrotolerans]